MMEGMKRYTRVLVAIAIVVLVNIASSIYHSKVDLTEERRFSMTAATEKLLEELDGPIYIQVLLEGDFPAAGFKRLQTATRETLQQFNKINSDLMFRFEDPMFGSQDEVKERLEGWSKVGILPTQLNVKGAEGQSMKQIYPFAIFNYGDRQVAINLLERESAGIPPEIVLNNSVSLLEYKFANAISKLQAEQKPNILFSEGHGELTSQQTASFEGNLRAFYNTARINLDSIYRVPKEIDVLIIAKPTMVYSDKAKFVLDQYIMHGGNVLFLIDPLAVNLDSIRKNGEYVPFSYDLGFDDMLFKYGCRVQPNLVLDLQSSKVPLAVKGSGSKSSFELFPWYYHPLALGVPDHPITKGLDRVNLLFPGSIDTVKTRTQIRKTPLLVSSPYTRLQFTPVVLDFGIVRRSRPEQFTGPSETLALLLEGHFPSVYENRVSAQSLDILKQIEVDFVPVGQQARILVVSDGDIVKNLVNPGSGQISEVGFNKFMNYTFDNKNFLTNAIEYMLDRQGLIEARSKNIKLRLLDKQRIGEEKLKWQLINVGLPLVLLLFFGWLFQFLRRRKYGRQLI